MAHGGASEDNPVHLNVAPMVDIIFCLCIFFMCSFQFKQLEGKMESWLPKDKGVFGDPVPNPILEEVRVFMKWDETTGETIRKVNAKQVGSNEELGLIMLEGINKFRTLGKLDTPVIVDAEPKVPWAKVIEVMDICKLNKLDKVELAAPMPGKQ
ncbi:MAG: biopolymer transporter ExbD [Candidatus Brocadiae bacterium]|nr:biopolymer transporter ExbD [Candidatus Brocadiia bacterium]